MVCELMRGSMCEEEKKNDCGCLYGFFLDIALLFVGIRMRCNAMRWNGMEWRGIYRNPKPLLIYMEIVVFGVKVFMLCR